MHLVAAESEDATDRDINVIIAEINLRLEDIKTVKSQIARHDYLEL